LLQKGETRFESWESKLKKGVKTIKKQIDSKNFHEPTNEEIKNFIFEINKIRSEHQVKQLTQSKELMKSAKDWAEKLAKQDKAENGQVQDQGEALFSYSGPNFELNTAINVWLSGRDKYDFNNPGFKQGCGNFTQIVWADTREIGVGAAECSKSGKIYVVARFKPSGNVIMTPPGERETFNKNVLVRKY